MTSCPGFVAGRGRSSNKIPGLLRQLELLAQPEERQHRDLARREVLLAEVRLLEEGNRRSLSEVPDRGADGLFKSSRSAKASAERGDS